jgi:hypothetical protein
LGQCSGRTPESRRARVRRSRRRALVVLREVVSIGPGESFRIPEIKTEIADELLDAGFNGVFVVEPADEG